MRASSTSFHFLEFPSLSRGPVDIYRSQLFIPRKLFFCRAKFGTDFHLRVFFFLPSIALCLCFYFKSS
uniref:Uncharacterized protein n=1 Tax=Salix viminalis TaxID=40686 RepID=A0A6N2LCE4_SALVM